MTAQSLNPKAESTRWALYAVAPRVSRSVSPSKLERAMFSRSAWANGCGRQRSGASLHTIISLGLAAIHCSSMTRKVKLLNRSNALLSSSGRRTWSKNP